MKKILVIALTVMLSVFATACNETSPTEVVNDYLESVKTQNTSRIEELYAGDSDDILMASEESEDNDTFSQEVADKMEEMLFSFEYSVSNEQINGDTATVDVSIKTYDLGSAMQEALGETFTKALELAFSGASDEEMSDATNEIFLEKFENASFDYEKTATVSLTKQDGKWIIDDFDDDSPFLDAVTGGMVTTLQGMGDLLDDSDSDSE